MPSMRDPPAVELVEAHQQVDERRLAGAGRADDRDVAPGCDVEARSSISGSIGLVAEGHVLERDRAHGLAERRPAGDRVGDSSGSSSSSNTRSAEATADCSTLTMLAVWMIGNVNWREYWMNATTSPMRHLAGCDAEAADDRDRHVVEVRDEGHRGLDDPGDELRPAARIEEPLVLFVEGLDRLALPAEHLHDRVTRCASPRRGR